MANSNADLYSKIILIETNRTKFIAKITLPVITSFIHNEHNTGQMNTKFV